jgi:hypothetical protein
MQTLGVTESNKKRMLEVSSLGPRSSNTIRNTTESKFKGLSCNVSQNNFSKSVLQNKIGKLNYVFLRSENVFGG